MQALVTARSTRAAARGGGGGAADVNGGDADGDTCCPSCGAGLHSPLLDEWAATQHLISCGDGGWWQRIANGITWALAMCYSSYSITDRLLFDYPSNHGSSRATCSALP